LYTLNVQVGMNFPEIRPAKLIVDIQTGQCYK